jgi:bifunctional ADP-heptose synthase (sugar kinase/adenylyltransferase)
LAGATLEEAAWIGNCASGVVVGKKGTATVNLEELTLFFHQLVKKIN